MFPRKILGIIEAQTWCSGLHEFKNLHQVDNTKEVDVYQLAKKQLQKRYGRKINMELERYKFYSRIQHEDESIDQFVAALRGLAVTCKFEQISYDQVLRDQLLMKTKSCKIQEKLWSCSSDLTLKGAVDVARTIEESEKCLEVHDGLDQEGLTEQEWNQEMVKDNEMQVVKGYILNDWPSERVLRRECNFVENEG
ncbi:hypothetical protein NDU88_004810 [Pleurodeles waltl]|uniref:Retrotransposon gag domain-containing protein n=1 Tax=Pleurodeles waltl TaxID=8319 RepID=A0AAV7TTM7_PLEWA|nr:hypothetical protein NDU88_004810 [Pleurodeles waltl]